MLDIRLIRDEPDAVRSALEKRGVEIDIGAILDVDRRRRDALFRGDELRALRNTTSEEIARCKKNGLGAGDAIARMREVGTEIKQLEETARESGERIREMLLAIPNMPADNVPVGTDERDNPEIRRVGDPPDFDFEPMHHADIGESLGILDFERGVRIARTRFTLYKGLGARLERACINFMLDLHTGEHGYTEVLPPFLVNSDTMTGTGQLPKFAEDLFKCDNWDLWLIPTAEVPVTNIHKNEVLDADALPIAYCAYTPCFRAEAGAAGKDTRGLSRQHQFNKVEMVQFSLPEMSFDALEKLTDNAEDVLRRLGLPYRVIELCTGDLGFSAAKTYDIEVWMPGQNTYREISSCSNFTDYQARRAGIRYKRDAGSKPEFVHTLNGSGLAVGRTVAAILENYQQPDGTVVVPEALRPYMAGAETIPVPTGR
ncbi:MAG: serine--tRNA ligase [Candidatus Hydrogenedentes bacterium]|nr:serine--tRNA ligase [Candidatus Hydrogenedentota bacterium]